MATYQPEGSHFIGGRYVEDTTGDEISVIYPHSGQIIATLYSATATIIDNALESARSAQQDWARLSGTERGRILREAAKIMRDRNRALSELETHDTGKPLSETLVADAASGADALEYFGGLAGTLTGDYIPLADGDFAYTRREPLGVCIGLGAWNYPIQIASWKAAPALACGNAMVFKPSEMTPLSALKLAEILVEAGAPPGVFNVIQGYGHVGASLAADLRVDKVSLTGSVSTGRKVYAAAAEGIRHVTLELGGKSPIVVFDDAHLENAVSSAINGNFYSTGQICSNGTRVFVQSGLYDTFVARVAERMENARIGDPMNGATTIGPMVSARQREVVAGYIAKGIEEGARLVKGGKIINGPGYYIEPTLFAGVTDDMTIAREEIFGPVMSVLRFETEDEAIARANATKFGLAAGVFTRDVARAHRVAASFQAGTCYINTYNLTPVEAPFGGSKLSGIGRENSKAAIDHYSQIKSVYVGMNDTEAPF